MASVNAAHTWTVSTLADTERAVYAAPTSFFRSSSFINILLTNNNNLDLARTLEACPTVSEKKNRNSSALLLVICRYHVEIGIKY